MDDNRARQKNVPINIYLGTTKWFSKERSEINASEGGRWLKCAKSGPPVNATTLIDWPGSNGSIAKSGGSLCQGISD